MPKINEIGQCFIELFKK